MIPFLEPTGGSSQDATTLVEAVAVTVNLLGAFVGTTIKHINTKKIKNNNQGTGQKALDGKARAERGWSLAQTLPFNNKAIGDKDKCVINYIERRNKRSPDQ